MKVSQISFRSAGTKPAFSDDKKQELNMNFFNKKEYMVSTGASIYGLGAFGIAEHLEKKSIAKKIKTATADQLKELSKTSTKRNLLIGLGAAIVGGTIGSQLYNLSGSLLLKIQALEDKQKQQKQ